MSKRWQKILIIGLAVLAAGFLIYIQIGKGKPQIKVTSEKASLRSITETVTASGQIYPEFEIKISPDISGEVTELTVQEGDSVTKGQVLARVYADVYALQRDEAAARVGQSQATVANSQAALGAQKATLDQAQQQYNRNKKLYDDKVISKSEFEQFETNLTSAKSNYNASLQNIRSLQAGVRSSQTGLTSANKTLSRATIVAPMSGVVSSLKIEKGERVVGTAQMAGTDMMTIADMNSIEVRVDVGENDIVKINIGDQADVEVDAYNDRKFKGIVTKIASSVNSGSAGVSTSNDVTNYEVRIRLEKPSYQDLIDPSGKNRFPFRPGMNARADIKTKQKNNVVAVPIAAVNARIKGSDKTVSDTKKEKEKEQANTTESATESDNNDLEEVAFMIMNDGVVKKRVVTTGIQDINYIEITSGLKAGDKIVTGPYNIVSQTLKDGDKVKVVTRDELFKKAK
ncbi:MAG TPA: efflux RND transporter periplasmic adaptor subunit [Niabella sp.]|nr:efflux RND transporter periplasmic adaptor subunit [Niabella sp.]HQX21676.1 efflux RND transporter periplasmic adaptor subunit [Niabella sp.]HRB27427.1 efflux RND transporter periplasmic adaptor subunit [Niabella sp.]HRB34496.1 efflux RND transporter periplasmic adaptor subunit [Niabella sp.]HRB44334.1 efflux RND transporter periplasmic adaptor subunit [Niabella sp.]